MKIREISARIQGQVNWLSRVKPELPWFMRLGIQNWDALKHPLKWYYLRFPFHPAIFSRVCSFVSPFVVSFIGAVHKPPIQSRANAWNTLCYFVAIQLTLTVHSQTHQLQNILCYSLDTVNIHYTFYLICQYAQFTLVKPNANQIRLEYESLPAC